MTENTKALLEMFNSQPMASISDENLKDKALRQIKQNDFPTRKDEEWKHASPQKILEHKFTTGTRLNITAEEVAQHLIPKLECNVLVFGNGYFLPEVSKLISPHQQLAFESMASASLLFPDSFEAFYERTHLMRENSFAALNTAHAADGLFCFVPDKQKVDKPIHLIHFVDAKQSHVLVQPRHLIVLGRNSQITLIESYVSLNNQPSLVNTALEIVLLAQAEMQHYLLQNESAQAQQINTRVVQQESESRYTAVSLTFTGNFVRNNLRVVHRNEYCYTDLSGLMLSKNNSHFDHAVNIRHYYPNSQSKQNYRAIADDQATAVYLGKVYVAKDAQKTDAQQQSKNILLSPKAKIRSKPQLEIYADDVACTHGSTTGQLNNDALFYMQSRGIPHAQAKQLLLKAFVAEILENIKLTPLQNYLLSHIDQQLNA